MSYVRFGTFGSDVYVYPDVDLGLRCCACKLESPPRGIASWDTRSRAELLAHLAEHRAAGHTVPDFVDEVLRDEITVCGDDAPGAMHRAQDRGDLEALQRITRRRPSKPEGDKPR